MRIAIIGDMHLGYPRFEEDAYKQAKSALEDAEKKADLILLAGDVFDTKIPRMEVTEKVISLFRKIKKPMIAIHGNHERRSRDMINPLQLLHSGGVLTYLHNDSKLIENNGVKINITGLGNIPSSYVREAVENTLKNNPPKEGTFNILLLHQTINELSIGEEELSLQEVEELPFDLVINGHIHKRNSKLNGKLILPGSTVVTQLKSEEQENRGYFLYDLEKKESEFVEIPCRKFELIKLEFKDAGIEEIKEKIEEVQKRISEDQITKIILTGTIKQGIRAGDISLSQKENIFIDNKLNAKTLREKIEQIKRLKDQKLSVRELAVKEIEDRVKGKVSFNSSELFEKLAQGVDEAEEYLEEKE